jgi:beta-fructofuranosidase
MAIRPKLHFTAQDGWINDPLGLTYHAGSYHLFFQYRRSATVWDADCYWGHATSPDLLTWTEQPVALPTGDGDDGCWSGSLVVPPGRDAVLFYTSVRLPDDHIGRIRWAVPADRDWRAWTKKDVVVSPPPDVELIAFRDPYVFHDGDAWRMLVGAGRADGYATVFGYRSSDLVEWVHTGQLTSRPGDDVEQVWTGTMWECVQLVQVDGAHLLVVSVWDKTALHYVACATGAYDGDRFRVGNWFRLTYGPAPYAASAYRDRHGRVGLIAWLRGVADENDTWTGAHSVPMLLAIEDGRPALRPHPNLAMRRLAAAAPRWRPGGPVEVRWSAREGESVEVTDATGAAVAPIAVGDRAVALTTPAGRSTMPWPGGEIDGLLDGPVLEIFSGGALLAAPVSAHHRGVRASAGDAAGRVQVRPLT